MAGEQDAVEVLRELVGIGVGAEVALGDARAEDSGDHVEQVALVADQPVPHRARLVVELGRRRDERAAAGHRVPGQPVLEQRPHPRLAARRAQRRPGHGLLETGAGVLEHL